MPTYKVVNVDQLDNDLTNMAQALKNRCGYTNDVKLSFPEDFMSAIERIGNLIRFVVEYISPDDGTAVSQTYTALKDMTWADFCASNYNDGSFAVEGGDTVLFNGNNLYYRGAQVSHSDTIIDMGVYLDYTQYLNALSEA